MAQPHVPPCSNRFSERVFDSDGRYDTKWLCRCCGKIMGKGRRNPLLGAISDPLCERCERLQDRKAMRTQQTAVTVHGEDPS